LDCGRPHRGGRELTAPKLRWKRRRKKEGPSPGRSGKRLYGGAWTLGRGQIMTAGARQLEREDKGGIAQEGVSNAKNRFFSPLRLHSITMQILARLQRAWCHPPARMRPPQATTPAVA
jgi:hypothetical protein